MDKQIENAMNGLLNTEIWSTNLYLSLQVYFEKQKLSVLSAWMGQQAEGCTVRISRLIRQLYRWGGAVTVNALHREPDLWKTIVNAVDKLVEHEKYVAEEVASLQVLLQNTTKGFSTFASQLYAHRIYTTDIFGELLEVLVHEKRRLLPAIIELKVK